MSNARYVEFNALPQKTRERLVACMGGKSSPRPLFGRNANVGGAIGLIVVIFMLLAGVGALLFLGRGPVQRPEFIAAYAFGLMLVLLVIFAMIREGKEAARFPFERGHHVFPIDLVVARDERLAVIPLTDIVGPPLIVHRKVNGGYRSSTLTLAFLGGTKEWFMFFSEREAQEAAHALGHARQAMAAAMQARDMNTLAAQDPFFDLKMSNVWTAAAADAAVAPLIKKPGTLWGASRWPRIGVALAIAAPLAAGVWFVRNIVFDAKAFTFAMEASSSSKRFFLGEYILYGGHRAEEAQKELDKLGPHPDSKLGREEAAAKLAGGTNKPFSESLRKHATEKAATKEIGAFFLKVLDYVEKSHTKVYVVIQPPTDAALAKIDAAAAAKAHGKTVSTFAKCLNAKGVVDHAVEGLRSLVSAHLSMSPHEDGPEVVRGWHGATPGPTLEITYDASAGDIIDLADQNFATVGMKGSASFKNPGDPTGIDIPFDFPPSKGDKSDFLRSGGITKACDAIWAAQLFQVQLKLEGALYK